MGIGGKPTWRYARVERHVQSLRLLGLLEKFTNCHWSVQIFSLHWIGEWDGGGGWWPRVIKFHSIANKILDASNVRRDCFNKVKSSACRFEIYYTSSGWTKLYLSPINIYRVELTLKLPESIEWRASVNGKWEIQELKISSFWSEETLSGSRWKISKLDFLKVCNQIENGWTISIAF